MNEITFIWTPGAQLGVIVMGLSLGLWLTFYFMGPR